MRHRTNHIAIAALASIAMAGAAHAQSGYTYSSLHPAGSDASLTGGGGGSLAGVNAFVGGLPQAMVWNANTGTFSALPAPDFATSFVYGTDGTSLVGSFVEDLGGGELRTEPVLWNSTTSEAVRLLPAEARNATARSVHGNQQVGHTTFRDFDHVSGTFFETTHASLWSGSAASWVDLSPAGSTASYANGVHQGTQVGRATFTGLDRAGLWTGTAESWTSLHPVGAVTSNAHAVFGNTQVGEVQGPGGTIMASLWTGTAESWVSLAPPSALASAALAVWENIQVGWVDNGEGIGAALWTGTADSYVDLKFELGDHWAYTLANNVWRDGDVLYISGEGFNTDTNLQEGWILTLGSTVIPLPSAAGLALGGMVLIGARRRR